MGYYQQLYIYIYIYIHIYIYICIYERKKSLSRIMFHIQYVVYGCMYVEHTVCGAWMNDHIQYVVYGWMYVSYTVCTVWMNVSYIVCMDGCML